MTIKYVNINGNCNHSQHWPPVCPINVPITPLMSWPNHHCQNSTINATKLQLLQHIKLALVSSPTL